MIKLRPRSRDTGLFVSALLLLNTAAFALDPSQWKHQQSLTVESTGIIKLALPPATLGASQPDRRDIRLLDSTGREVPIVLDVAAPAVAPTRLQARRVDVTLANGTTQVVIETGTRSALERVQLQTPNPAFLKAAKVEVRSASGEWTVITDGAPLFRQFGAEQLALPLRGHAAPEIRISIDDSKTRPIAITGAELHAVATTEPIPALPLDAAAITAREEFVGETVLTVALGARHVPLAAVEIATPEAVFLRRVRLTTREVANEVSVERELGQGTVYRLAIEGAEPAANLSAPATGTATAAELLVRIENGDSPPLAIESLRILHRPVWLAFSAAAPGQYTLLTGNPDATAPRYDLRDFTVLAGALRRTAARQITLGALEDNPAFRAVDALADAPLLGAALDVQDWRHARRISVATEGVHVLELDAAALAGSRDAADIRLVRDGRQVPYLLERPQLSRAIPLPVVRLEKDVPPQHSRWQLTLPARGMPVTQLTLRTSTPLFQRQVSVYQIVADSRGSAPLQRLADAVWQRNRGGSDKLMLPLDVRPTSDRLIVETDDGDNPPIALTGAEIAQPVVRLVFRATPGELTLHYGNPRASAPRYDLALVADQLVAAPRKVVTLDRAQPEAADKGPRLPAGVLFWGALALVTVTLLVVVAKLLPVGGKR